jgi:NitT/TauT family transport system substrate-binding protein
MNHRSFRQHSGMKSAHLLSIWPIRLALFACLIGDWQPTFAAAPTISIILQLDGQSDTSAAGAIVAAKAGLFAQQGLDLKIERVENGSAIEDRSSIVVRLQNARDFLIARSVGAPLIAIAGNEVDSSVAFLFRRDRQIRSEQDLAGKSIGYDLNSDTGLIFEWFLAKNSVPRSRITELPTISGSKGIIDNKVDVLVGHLGIDDLALQKAGIAYEALDPRQYGVHALGTVYVTSEASVRQNPEALIGFLRALIAGWDLVYADNDRVLSMIGSETDSKSDRDGLRRALERERELLRPGGARFGEALRSRWSEIYAYMFQRRLLKSPIDLSRATDARLLADAYRIRPGSRKMAD